MRCKPERQKLLQNQWRIHLPAANLVRLASPASLIHLSLSDFHPHAVSQQIQMFLSQLRSKNTPGTPGKMLLILGKDHFKGQHDLTLPTMRHNPDHSIYCRF